MPFDLSSARVVEEEEEDRIPLESEIGPVAPVNAEAPSFDLSSAKVTDESAFDLSSAKVSPMLSQRDEIMAELDANPSARKLTMQMLDTEGGGTATLEALVNRTAMIRSKVPGWKISDELTSGFYGPINSGYAQKRDLDPDSISQYQKHIDEVRSGSNVIQGRTDQGYPGDPNSHGPGRVLVADNPKEIYNYWTGRRRGVDFSHEDSAKFAMDLQGSGEGLTVEPSAPQGMLEQGNIDLSKRPIIKNPDGTISTERSFSIGEDGKEVLIPLIVNGKELSQQEAIDHYRKTGEHMGKFKDVASADAYAEIAHNRPMIEPAESKEVPAKKEVGLIESAKRGVMSSSLGIGEAVNRYAYSPVVHGISEAIQAVAPESEVAKKAKEFDDAFFKHTVEEPAQMRKKLEFDPETEKRTVAGMDLGKTGEVAGELAELGGALVPDIATAALTQGATAAKAIPKVFETAAPTIMNAIKSYAPQLAVGARSFMLPAMKSGMEAAKQVKEQGGSEVDQNAAFLTNTLKTISMAAVPMAAESKLATLPARIASRTAQGGALAGATGELERTGSNIVLGEERPFSLVESFKQVATGGVLGPVFGRKGEPAKKLQQAKAAPKVTEPFMPTVVVNGEPFTASSHAEAVVQATRKHGKNAAAKGASGMLDDQGRFVSNRTNDIENRLSSAIRGNLPQKEIATIEGNLARSQAQDALVPVRSRPPGQPPPLITPLGPEPRIKRAFGFTKKIVGDKVKIKGIEADPGRFIQGTAEIMEKWGFTALGQAIRDHIDQWRVYSGMTHAPIRRWAKGVSQADMAKAQGEFRNYWQSVDEQWQTQAAPGQPVTNASDSIYNAASPKGKEIIDISKRLFSETGDLALANKLDVFNHETGKWRPFRKIAGGKFFPRRISAKWHEILSKPTQYPEEYAEIRREAVAMGYIKQPDDFNVYVARVLQTHTPDDLSPIEHARTSPLPTRVYDYGFDQMINYLNNWSWDMARIEAFGQQSSGKLDLFKKSEQLTSDTYSKGYIKDVQNIAYRKQNSGAWAGTLNAAQTVATISMLANYLSSMRNLIGGIKYNAHYNGVSAAFKAFFRVHEMADHIDDAYERGILQDNFFNMQEDVSNLRSPLQKTLEKGFKVFGQKLAEDWTRGMTLMAARDFLRNAVAENQVDPASPKMIQIRAKLQRLGPGINIEKLLREGGQSGPLTDRFLRQNVATIQGGYQYDMTPMTLNTPGGRLIFQFQKWGTQAADIFVKNVASPAVQAISGGKVGKQETVQVPDGMGGMKDVKVPGAILPAVRFLLLSTAAGLTQKELQQFIFGIEDKEASFAEIVSRLEKGDSKAFGDLLSKVFFANMAVGAAGVIGNYGQLFWEVTRRTRFKDPSSPPGLVIPKLLVGAFVDWATQGKLTGRDWDAYARNALSSYRTVQAMGAQLNDAFGGNILPLQAVSNRNDITFLRSRTRRYDNVLGVAPSTFGGAPPSKTELTPFTADLKEALMMGDSLRASDLLDEHFAGKTRAEREVEMKRIKASVRGSQPIRAGGGSGEAMAANFLEWAGENLPMTEVMRIIDIDNRYVNTAIGLRLMDPRDPTMKERRAALQRIENRRAFRK